MDAVPSSTFFRLPEEKRKRLINAAWEEFTRVRYENASVNQIIHKANIPRGSFYQYFSDKEDLLRYLLVSCREHYTQIVAEMLEEEGGNLLALPLKAFDRYSVSGENDQTPPNGGVLTLLQKNPGLDLKPYFMCSNHLLHDSIRSRLDLSRLRSRDPDFVEQTFALLLMCTASAVVDSLLQPETRQNQRWQLEHYLEIITNGCAAPHNEQ